MVADDLRITDLLCNVVQDAYCDDDDPEVNHSTTVNVSRTLASQEGYLPVYVVFGICIRNRILSKSASF